MAQGRSFIVFGTLVVAAMLLAVEPAPAQRLATGVTSDQSYEAKLAAYMRARAAYEAQASAYWNAIADKRRVRFAKRRNGESIVLDDYVLNQPPVYTGPPRPVDPNAPEHDPTRPPPRPIPIVADFLRAAAEHYKFVPQRPASELEFKRSYARAARSAGLTRDQIVRIYAFETGGNGTYDVQSGLTHPRPNARAISTAIGYNQLLTTNSVSLLAGYGDQFLQTLRQKDVPEAKVAHLRRMIAFSRTVPNQWSEHDKLAKTRGGMGIHTAVLDRDFGPLLQVQKLLTSLKFAQAKGHTARLTAAELEMMNLTGDGNGIDLVTMPQSLRERVPTANFFQRGGYERNGIARRTATVAGLYAEMNGIMDRLSQQPGAKDLASAF
ncbi:MAG: hypothetical protein IT536_03360 [Hyphomicrobiales bacterium]|nr:hypothetical protein [Hyphomicrobiales bacterium]